MMAVPLRLVLPAASSWRRIQALLPRIGTWWVGQIQAMLPAGIQSWAKVRPDDLQLRIDEYSIEVAAASGAAGCDTGVFDLDDAGKPTSPLHTFLRRQVSARTRVALVIPRENLVVRTIALPAVAKENLRQVLAYEMDRHTPFTAEQVYYDYCILEETSDHIHVRLFVSSRDDIDRALRMVERLELRLHVIRLAIDAQQRPGADAINLLPPEMRPPRFSRRRLMNAALLGLILLQLAALLAIPFWRQEQRMTLLEGELKQARTAAEAAFGVRDQRDALLASLDHILEQRQATPTILQIVEELSARLPDNTWLQRIEIRGTGIQLQGESSFASALIQLLEDSPLLMEVNFRSPVTQDPRTGQENFQIAARLSQDGAP